MKKSKSALEKKCKVNIENITISLTGAQQVKGIAVRIG